METTEYKPTYEQLKLVVSLMERALEDARMKTASFRRNFPSPNDPLPATEEEVNKFVKIRTHLYMSTWVIRPLEEALSILAPPPPTYEEVTVERWECVECGATYKPENVLFSDGVKHDNFSECGGLNGKCTSREYFKLTGTRRVPVKQPVRKSAVISFDNFGCYHVLSGDSNVNGTNGTYNWEE